MIFTVIKYLPILEETPGHRVEMIKKACPDDEPPTDGTDDGGSDDDTSKDEKTDLYDIQSFDYFNATASEHCFYTKHRTYRYLIENIHTPPPKL